jgi:hypothetical protein
MKLGEGEASAFSQKRTFSAKIIKRAKNSRSKILIKTLRSVDLGEFFSAASDLQAEDHCYDCLYIFAETIIEKMALTQITCSYLGGNN